MQITLELAQAIANYLVTKPYGEVFKLLEELQKQNSALVSQTKDKEIIIQTEIITIEKEIDTKDKTSEAPLYYKQLMEKMQKNLGVKR